MHSVHVLFSPEFQLDYRNSQSQYDACVVIDVLRATSTIVTALANGAIEIVPVLNLEDTVEYSQKGYLTAGERGGVKPGGFALGNSPLEYSVDTVRGKKICLTTTNGTKALIYAKELSKNIYVASFLNASSTAEELRRYEKIAIVCAGNNGDISYEDTQLAGHIVECLTHDTHYMLSDSALISLKLWEHLKKPQFRGSHALKLMMLGFEKDVEYCSNVDIYDFVVQYDGEKLRLIDKS
ncbi:MAG: 2-phosphosulfolactate phosphatase [Fervidobacterium sp.]|nr:2-phosphosulfolactate phosphatase [Fervidobacterium sp.]HPT53457.1 2-phosphosulfolactate phosphatase [Fervidobacterium sp.]